MGGQKEGKRITKTWILWKAYAIMTTTHMAQLNPYCSLIFDLLNCIVQWIVNMVWTVAYWTPALYAFVFFFSFVFLVFAAATSSFSLILYYKVKRPSILEVIPMLVPLQQWQPSRRWLQVQVFWSCSHRQFEGCICRGNHEFSFGIAVTFKIGKVVDVRIWELQCGKQCVQFLIEVSCSWYKGRTSLCGGLLYVIESGCEFECRSMRVSEWVIISLCNFIATWFLVLLSILVSAIVEWARRILLVSPFPLPPSPFFCFFHSDCMGALSPTKALALWPTNQPTEIFQT